jgi:uncharacterized protein (DUF1800 family)
MASGLNRPSGVLDARGALAPYRGPWNDRIAAHLLRRAGFGGTPNEIAACAARGNARDAVEALIHFADTSALPAPADVYDPQPEIIALIGAPIADRKTALMEIRKKSRDSIISMQMWWLNRMLATPAPLQEKMTFLLHGHFTTAAIQKGVWPVYVYNQNALFRSYALGNLRDLTLSVSKDPAMLLYLDNASNNKAHPNENYARELMELFTLGHGNYSEEDIRQSARAFTGWTVNRRTGQFANNSLIHDAGTKTFLGRSGNFDGSDIVSIIYQQPAAARFWAATLLGNFVYNDPEPQLVDSLATTIRKYDFNIAPVMSTLLQSNVFFSARAYRAIVKSPVEFVVGTHKALALPEIDANAPRALNLMGQILFYPPNVAGWPGGENWVTSQTMIARQNFLAQLTNSPMMDRSAWIDRTPMDPKRASQELIGTLLQDDAPDEARAQLVAYFSGASTSALKMLGGENFQERVRGAAYLTMAMPAYQLA